MEVGEVLLAGAAASSKRDAAQHLASLTPCATWVWTDGPATGGVLCGGAGALIVYADDDRVELRRPAGVLCSSFRAEMMALAMALEHLAAHLAAHPRDDELPVIICVDSQSALAALREEPLAQRTSQGAEVWNRLLQIAATDRLASLQWVPSHCEIPGNEAADALAGEATVLEQGTATLDVNIISKAVARRAEDHAAQDRPTYPDPTRRAATGWYRELMGTRIPPPISKMDWRAAVDVHQIRTGRWSGSSQYLHSIGRNPTAACAHCRCLQCEAARCPLCGEEADTPGTYYSRARA